MISGIQDYKLIKLDHEHQLSDDLKVDFMFVWTSDKVPALLFLLNEVVKKDDTTIIFAATKYHVEYLHSICQTAQLESVYVYGNLDMEARTLAITKFRRK